MKSLITILSSMTILFTGLAHAECDREPYSIKFIDSEDPTAFSEMIKTCSLIASGSAAEIAEAIKKGADMNLYCDDGADLYGSIANIAAAKRTPEILELILKSGVSINQHDTSDMSPIQTAAATGNIANLNFLIQAKAKLNCGGTISGMRTPLLMAIAKDSKAAVKALIEAKAEVNSSNNAEILNPLNFVARFAKDDFYINELIQAGADIEFKNNEGRTPFLDAAMIANLNTLQILKNKGANVNAVDAEGKSALMILAVQAERAQSADQKEAIRNAAILLKSLGVSVQMKALNGLTAFDMAQKLTTPELAILFK